jgi:hypothetical protein
VSRAGSAGCGRASFASSEEPGLEVTGLVHFSRSGSAVVNGSTSKHLSKVTVTGVSLTSTTRVLATLQTFVSGVGVAAVVIDVPASSFTIHLTKSVSVPATVEWLLID